MSLDREKLLASLDALPHSPECRQLARRVREGEFDAPPAHSGLVKLLPPAEQPEYEYTIFLPGAGRVSQRSVSMPLEDAEKIARNNLKAHPNLRVQRRRLQGEWEDLP